MGTFSGFRVFIIVIAILSSTVAISGLHCYHCIQARELIYNGSETQIEDFEETTSSLLPSHSSCAYGEEPESNLSVECSTEHLVIAMFRDNYTDKYNYEDLEYKINALMKQTHGQRFACVALVATEPMETLSDGVTSHVQTTIRTCIPDHLNFTTQMELFESTPWGRNEVSGYTCDMFNNCNGKGDAKSHKFSQSPPDVSSGPKSTGLGGGHLIACISLMMKLLY